MSSQPLYSHTGSFPNGHVTLYLTDILFAVLVVLVVLGLLWLSKNMKTDVKNTSQLDPMAESEGFLNQGASRRSIPTQPGWSKGEGFTEPPVFWESNADIQKYYHSKDAMKEGLANKVNEHSLSAMAYGGGQ